MASAISEITVLREKAGLSIEEFAVKIGYSSRRVYDWEQGKAKPRAAIIDYLNRAADISNNNTNQKPAEFRFIDLFAGIGGMRIGFEEIGGQCVFTSEWDKYSRQTYAANHTCDHHIDGDITMIDAADIPEHDVLLAGFPCQPFSIAGVSKKNSLGRQHGFKDETQGTLFFDVVRILEYHKPAAFLLENVKNLRSHDKGKTYKVIMGALEELGYNVEERVVNAKGYVPQNRERILIAGFLTDSNFRFDEVEIPSPIEGPTMGSILHPQDGTELQSEYLDETGKVLSKYTLSKKLWDYLRAYKEKHRKQGNGFGFGLVGPDDKARTLSARYFKDGSEILIKQGRGRRPRRLTPRECARLMGFDNPNRKPFEIPVSDTQSYKQFGNAVVVPVIEHVAREMKPHILRSIQFREGQQELPLAM